MAAGGAAVTGVAGVAGIAGHVVIVGVDRGGGVGVGGAVSGVVSAIKVDPSGLGSVAALAGTSSASGALPATQSAATASDYVCNACGRHYRVEGSLRRHQKLACGRERPRVTGYVTTPHGYFCERCGRRYKVRTSVIRHLRYECGKQAKIRCPVDGCEYKAKHRSRVKQHMIIVHEIYADDKKSIVGGGAGSAGVSAGMSSGISGGNKLTTQRKRIVHYQKNNNVKVDYDDDVDDKDDVAGEYLQIRPPSYDNEVDFYWGESGCKVDEDNDDVDDDDDDGGGDEGTQKLLVLDFDGDDDDDDVDDDDVGDADDYDDKKFVNVDGR